MTGRTLPRARRGFTLAELTVSLAVVALIGAVAASLTTAALRARDHAVGLSECSAQGRAVADRLRAAAAAAAIVRAPDGSAVPAIFAVRPAGESDDGSGGPRLGGDGERLVVWCGGRGGARPGDAVQTRSPRAEELLIFTVDPARPWRLVEAWPEGNDAEVDLFADLPARIREVLAKAPAPLTVADRVRVADRNAGPAGCVRFTVSATPTAAAIAAAAGDADALAELPWVGGAGGAPGGSPWGLRSVRVRACVQLTPLAGATSSAGSVRPVPPSESVPYFAPAARVYRFDGN